ncbi:LysR family transcriptional regulator [Yinghuangia seranimata]|uniref:LysR family transcriptional regulator n=1 Tax=Yinghuangia seranimata TaxID=408067 RepID=UPI00248ACF65|nr:LysR family transcriptional regulator [Yinghuangia seranimata]MDI2126003.1 LysR family transcriptional regulator [Yinghuangia seranimata]
MAHDLGADPRLTVHQLRRLVAVAEHGSISAAAAALFIAQPALSKSLLELERNVGTRLLARTNRGTVLSPEGERAVRLARVILADVHAFEGIGRADPADGEQPLRIAATPTLAGDLGTHLIPTFVAGHPHVQTRLIRSASREALFASLRAGEVDVGVAAAPVPEDLAARRFWVREVVLVSPQGVDLPDTLTSAHLHDLPLVLPPPGSGRRDDIDAFFARTGIRPRVAMEAEERSAWVACVRAGLGSVFLYRDLCEHLEYPGTVVRAFDPPVRGAVALVWRPGAAGERAAAFIAHAEECGLRPSSG